MNIANGSFFQDIKTLLYEARNRVYQTINTTMTMTYFQVGKSIVEEEQGGEIRADYGKVLDNTINMYGSIRGIAGNAIGNIKALELGYSGENLENGDNE